MPNPNTLFSEVEVVMSNSSSEQHTGDENYDPTIEAIMEDRIWSELLQDAPSFLISMVVHILAILIFASIYISGPSDNQREIVSNPGEMDEVTDLDDIFDDLSEPLELDDMDESIFDTDIPATDVAIGFADDINASELMNFASLESPTPTSFSDMVNTPGALTTTGLEGRGKKAGLGNGGSEGSEAAVAMALRWIADHQLPNGGWSYDHRKCPKCGGKCKDHGTNSSMNSATAMAIMPFLGAGITDRATADVKKSEHFKVVKAGMTFLINGMKTDPKAPRDALSFIDENHYGLYHHGICTIVICEAAAMTGDKTYKRRAEQAVNFILYAQDPRGGGWRYQPKQAGDTSAVGWQWMALKSAEMGYIPIPAASNKLAVNFLDFVSYDNGAGYGYTDNSRRGSDSKATTAIGLLCRMYSGWRPDNSALQRGVNQIGSYGPDMNNVYFNYYATQVMHQYGGEAWHKWNGQMRDALVETQGKEGHEKGSWWYPGGHGEHGGRLYYTAMSTMILEVYYRHMPLFKQLSAQEVISLD